MQDSLSHTFISVFRVVEEGRLRSFSDWHPCTELVILELASEGKGHALYCSCVLQCTYCLLYTFAFSLDNSVDSCTKSSIYQCIFDLLCGAELHSWNTKFSLSQGMAESCRRPCFTAALLQTLLMEAKELLNPVSQMLSGVTIDPGARCRVTEIPLCCRSSPQETGLVSAQKWDVRQRSPWCATVVCAPATACTLPGIAVGLGNCL